MLNISLSGRCSSRIGEIFLKSPMGIAYSTCPFRKLVIWAQISTIAN